MRKLFCILFLLIATVEVHSQPIFKSKLYFSKGYSYDNQAVIDFYTKPYKVNGKTVRMMDYIVSVGGKTSLLIPEKILSKSSGLYMIIDHVPVRYRIVGKEIQMINTRVRAKSINFNEKKVTTVDLNSDVDFRPKNYKEKLLAKHPNKIWSDKVIVLP